ncbi:hypothetical protein [Methylocapsa sp. S129]|uniref:hypothetical protein n=1 Tax=Methylocapsa sp. S129 TaxID=1641869 RepID=UPI00131D45DD|nr:hypothetical protein [Methylocapsa sp. S129]
MMDDDKAAHHHRVMSEQLCAQKAGTALNAVIEVKRATPPPAVLWQDYSNPRE